MHYTDTHVHLQDYKISEAKKLVAEASVNNVCEFVVPSSNPDDWDKVIKTARLFKCTIPAIGIHPWYAQSYDKNRLTDMEKYLKKYPDLWVGECGLDRAKDIDEKKQYDLLTAQIELANKYERPLILHNVKADDLFAGLLSILPKRTIFHSFTGSVEWGKKIQKNEFYLGIGFAFFKKKNAPETLKQLDLDKILLETDAPYQQRKGYVKNSSENLPVLASAMAAILGLSETGILAMLAHNWKTFNKE